MGHDLEKNELRPLPFQEQHGTGRGGAADLTLQSLADDVVDPTEVCVILLVTLSPA